MTDNSQHIVGLTVSMHPANMIQITMTVDGKPTGSMALDCASAKNIIAGLQTHIGYLKGEKFDA